MLLVVPTEKRSAESQGILVAAESLWKVGTILQRFVLAFRKWIVVGDVRSAVRLRYS